MGVYFPLCLPPTRTLFCLKLWTSRYSFVQVFRTFWSRNNKFLKIFLFADFRKRKIIPGKTLILSDTFFTWSVKPFWCLLDTNKKTIKQAKFKDTKISIFFGVGVILWLKPNRWTSQFSIICLAPPSSHPNSGKYISL